MLKVRYLDKKYIVGTTQLAIKFFSLHIDRVVLILSDRNISNRRKIARDSRIIIYNFNVPVT